MYPSEPSLLIYDDARGRFGPLTHTRPVFCLRYSSRLAGERIEHLLNRTAACLFVPPHLADVTRLLYPQQAVNQLPAAERWLSVNGRWPGYQHIQPVQQLEPDHALLQADGQIIAANLNAGDTRQLIDSSFTELPDHVTTITSNENTLLERPWDAFDLLEPLLMQDLLSNDLPLIHPGNHPGVMVFGQHPVRVGENVRIMPSVVIDSGNGPVVIDNNAEINALSILQGPCYIGEASVLVAHASVRRASIIGPHCKIGGEMAYSAFHGYTNKVHAGFMGNALVGQWCNFGADTNVSNLKNTYGTVRVQIDDQHEAEDTGRQFHGPIIGDYVRTAIGSKINTGSVIGTGTALALCSFSPKYCPPFSFFTDNGRQTYDWPKFLATAQTVMARRDTTMTSAEETLLKKLYERYAQ